MPPPITTMTKKIYEPYFLQENHKYHSPDGEVLDSVTTILKEEFGLYKYGNIGKATFGTDCHTACQYYDEKDLDESTLDKGVALRLAQYKRALKDTGAVVLANELRRYCNKFRYAGTLDKLWRQDGALWVIDIKTGKPENWHELQTAAYLNMIKHEHAEPIRRGCLYLADDDYTLVEHTGKSDFGMFLALLTAHNVKLQFGYRKRKE